MAILASNYRVFVICGLTILLASSAQAIESRESASRTAEVRQALDAAEQGVRYQTDAQASQQVRSTQESWEATWAALSLHRQTDVFGYGILRIPRE